MGPRISLQFQHLPLPVPIVRVEGLGSLYLWPTFDWSSLDLTCGVGSPIGSWHAGCMVQKARDLCVNGMPCGMKFQFQASTNPSQNP